MNKETDYSVKSETLREVLNGTYFAPEYHGRFEWDALVINRMFSEFVKVITDKRRNILFEDRLHLVRNDHKDKNQARWIVTDGRHRMMVFSLIVACIQRRLLLHLLAWKEATSDITPEQKSMESAFIAELDKLAAELDGYLLIKDDATGAYAARITHEDTSSGIATYMEDMHRMYMAYQTPTGSEHFTPKPFEEQKYTEILKAIDSNLENLVENGKLMNDGIAWYKEQLMHNAEMGEEEEYQALASRELYKKLVGLSYFADYLLNHVALLIYRHSSTTGIHPVSISNYEFGTIGIQAVMKSFTATLQRRLGRVLERVSTFRKG